MKNSTDNKEKDENIHKKHRQRMRNKYIAGGIESFADHEKLELLLFFVIPRKNTNPIAHALLEKFKTLEGVFEADTEDLMTVEGIGENAAVFIQLVRDLGIYVKKSALKKGMVLKNLDTAGPYVVNFFSEYKKEVLFAFFLNKGSRLIGWEKITEGSVDSIPINTADIVREAVKQHAYSVILAHNHPGDNPNASMCDAAATITVAQALRTVNIELKDHIIVAGEHYSSVFDSGLI